MKTLLSRYKWKLLQYIGAYKPTPNRFHTTTLQDRIAEFRQRHKDKALPERELSFLPEIIIPCYNHGAYLPYLLKSLQHCPVPITIVDDNSTDQTAAIIRGLQQDFSFKTITNSENLLQWGSINKAVRQSQNTIFIIVNADDFVFPAWVGYAMDTIRQDSISLIGGTYLHIDLPTEHLESKNEETARMAREFKINPEAALHRFSPEDAPTFTNDNSINMSFTGCAFLRSAWDFVDGMQPLQNRVSWHDDRDFQMRIAAFFPVAVSENLAGFVRNNSSQGRGMS